MAGGAGSRLGGHFVGSRLAKPFEIPTGPNDLHAFRHYGTPGLNTTYLRELVYVWGRLTWETTEAGGFSTPAASQDKLYCLPQVFPVAGRIRKLYIQGPSGTMGGGLRLGLVGNTDGLAYPGGAPLWVSADQTPAFVAPKGWVTNFAPDVAVSAGELVWLALQWNAACSGLVLRSFFSNEALILGGMAPAAWDNNTGWSGVYSPLVGWTIPAPYASGFPTSIPYGTTEAPILAHAGGGAGYALPAIGFTFEAD